MTNIDHKRYFYLLEKSQQLETKDLSLYDKNIVEYKELLAYRSISFKQITYQDRQKYISLIEKYINNEVNSPLLRFRFFQLQRDNRNAHKDLEKNFEQLSNVLISSKSDEFASIIQDSFAACEALKSEDEPEEAWGITEVQFRVCLEEALSQMQNLNTK